ncbi:MAG: YigZ family protein [Ruminococcaceae bacterium]|nr:YigZ family protein [Oscillospiraceae bacterium]
MAEKKIKRLKQSAKIEFVEKKSVFIGYATVVKDEEEALSIIKSKKKEYADATHNVYAYMIGDNIARYSDDNEPQGTAGMPTLNSIRMSGITDVLVVVTRYFGGILLGAGGLVRAYSTAASMALDAGGEAIFESYSVMRIKCSYSDYGKINIELTSNNAIIDNTSFEDDVTIDFAIKEDIHNKFLLRITDLFSGRIIPEVVGQRIDSN